MPSPPAGFILDNQGDVTLMAPPQKRVLTIVDPETQRPLDCQIRRLFVNSQGLSFFLLLPLDTPIQILKIQREKNNIDELEEQEIVEIMPHASYALAKKALHLVHTGFCLTARGALCFTEDDVVEFDSEFGELGLGGNNMLEGVEIVSFVWRGTEYIIYTPFDPLMFVAYRTEDGQLRIAEDDLLDDPKVIGALEEEEEFKLMVDREDEVKDAIREAMRRSRKQPAE
eukprot:jgi/Mesen1/7656/ME000400S06850